MQHKRDKVTQRKLGEGNIVIGESLAQKKNTLIPLSCWDRAIHLFNQQIY